MANPTAANGINGETNNGSKAENGTGSTPEQVNGDKKISGAELKKLQKQEKAARRAKEKESKAPDQVQDPPASSAAARKPPQHRDGKQQPKSDSVSMSKQQGPSQQRVRRASGAAPPQATVELPLRRNAGEPKKASKAAPFFAHAYGTARRRTLEGTPKDVHPAISTLALHLSSYVICGSHARGVATLLAFKSVLMSLADNWTMLIFSGRTIIHHSLWNVSDPPFCLALSTAANKPSQSCSPSINHTSELHPLAEELHR